MKPAPDPHRWAMARTWQIDADTAAAVAAGEQWTPEGEGRLDGPGCTVCRQSYAQASALPCPGRPVPDVGAARNAAMSALPRNDRRQLQVNERREARDRRRRAACPHPPHRVSLRTKGLICLDCGASVALNREGAVLPAGARP